MAVDPDQIYKALRPVPEFDGNPNILTRFIRICDQIVTQYIRTDPGNELNNLSLINGILNKITGPAARTINSNGIPENWLGIRTALINNFSDQRDETALYNDLSLLTQGNSSPQEFYDKCQTLFSTLMTYVTLHESIATTIEAKRDLYKKLTMQAFVRGLKEPLGSRIRCMRPTSIEKALEFVQEELNIMYLQQRNGFTSERRNLIQPTPTPPVKTPHMFPVAMPKPLSFGPNPGPSWERQPPPGPNNHWKPAFKFNAPQRMPNMPSRTQQMFASHPPNYNPRSNVFRLPQRNQGPKPMSGISHYVAKQLPLTGHDWSKSGNPPPTNYFKTREMNINECYDNNGYYYPDNDYYTHDYDPNYYIDYTNYDADYNNYEIYDYYDPTINDCPPNGNKVNEISSIGAEAQPSTSHSDQDFPVSPPLKLLK